MTTATATIPKSQAISTETRVLIDNEWVPSESGKTFPAFNPATGEELAQICEADTEDVDKLRQGCARCF